MFVALREINNGTAWKPERVFTEEDAAGDPVAYLKTIAARCPGTWAVARAELVAITESDPTT